jgi:RHS repeat-associated protein
MLRIETVGNRTSSLGTASYSYNSSNELTSTSAATYTYDNNGNTLTKVAGSSTTSFAWDFENRLSTVTLPGTQGTVTFKYDPFGRRIRKVSPTTTSIYIYDGDNQIEEVNASGTAVARYTQGLGIDEPLVLLRSGVTSYYHADGLGSVNALSQLNGSYDEVYKYDSFGVRTGFDGNITNAFQYTARERDDETSLYYYRARYYDPSVGRFLNEDPARFDGSVDFYTYVNNNPPTYKDPFGQGVVDCAAELAKLGALEARQAIRRAQQAAASCRDKNHQKSIDQLQRAIEKQRDKVRRHCSDADTRNQLLLFGLSVAAIALTPETGGGSLGWAWGVAAAIP